MARRYEFENPAAEEVVQKLIDIREAFGIAGEKFEVWREDELRFELEGMKNRQKKEIRFEPNADIQEGDMVKAIVSGDRFFVTDVDTQVIEGKPYTRIASYQSEASKHSTAREQQPSQVFNVQNAYGSVFGSQQDFKLEQTFTLEDLSRQIDERGGEDAGELHDMVREIRQTLENQDSITRSRFLGWSELLNKHSWITGPIAQMLMLYTTTGQLS